MLGHFHLWYSGTLSKMIYNSAVSKRKTIDILKFCVYIIGGEVIGRCISEEINF